MQGIRMALLRKEEQNILKDLSCCYTAIRFMSSSNIIKRAVMSFGDGTQGALGLPTTQIGLAGHAYEPIRVPSLPPDITAVTAGHYHSLAVTSQGHLWAWGRNLEAQLGRGLVATPRDTWNEPRKVEGLDQVSVRTAFASGVISAAIGDDGSLWVWGKSKRGQLGLGKNITEAVVPSKVKALAGEKIVKASFGWGHALALTEDGKLFGWGYSADGRIGRVGDALEVSLLDSTSNISRKNHQLSSSTLEAAEQLVLEGMEKENNMPIIWDPCLVEELHGVEVADIACGLDHSLVLCGNGTLLSCGSNVYGQLGRAKQDVGMFPVDITFRPMSIASGLGHSLAISQVPSPDVESDATSVISWGWNQSSQLGRAGPENLPLVVEGLAGETPVAVSGGRVHSITLTSKGEVWVWGCGKNGRLGLGSSIDEVEPMLVDSLEGCEALQVVSVKKLFSATRRCWRERERAILDIKTWKVV
ncbi:RCC1 domain-containing protein/RCC1_2 domain-containing protein [Cephalotus follicularis]|uniref:RCC1 domain-containing protein/RCC1_2 domain-containing protein n=1 Tax=Cephalotus follicularis TaxID=3775 RepID=A0A1Q3BKQ2_CEPFO|nr:RCC1 domain-containing protein/RCC1_2 domain-containing protein [Cephalotus follicularis]